MKIALVSETYPPEINGVSRTLERLVHGLVERGHEMRLVLPHRRDRCTIPREGNPSSCLVPAMPLPGYPELRLGLPCAGRLQRLWKADPPSVVHVATEGPLGWCATAVARRARIPVASTFHTNFHSYGRHYHFRAFGRVALRYLRRMHNRTDRTLVPSQTVLRMLEENGFRNLDILGRGVDSRLFTPRRRDASLRRSWGASADTPVALYVGRLAKEKNIGLAVRAVEAMQALQPRLRFVLVGDGPLRAELERRHPEFHFAGMRRGEDLARHYASGDVFLFPSLTETFGNVVTEAMASALVVLAFDYAAAGQHIESGRNGCAVAQGDEEAFVREARDLIRQEWSWPALRWAARITAAGLSWDGIVDRFEHQLRETASGRGF
jgi:glycosyltransferase involved in cell wall biosynthesis